MKYGIITIFVFISSLVNVEAKEISGSEYVLLPPYDHEKKILVDRKQMRVVEQYGDKTTVEELIECSNNEFHCLGFADGSVIFSLPKNMNSVRVGYAWEIDGRIFQIHEILHSNNSDIRYIITHKYDNQYNSIHLINKMRQVVFFQKLVSYKIECDSVKGGACGNNSFYSYKRESYIPLGLPLTLETVWKRD